MALRRVVLADQKTRPRIRPTGEALRSDGSVEWFPEPVPLIPGGHLLVHGVARDADAKVFSIWGRRR